MSAVPELYVRYFDSIPERLAPLFRGSRRLWDPLDRLAEFVRAVLRPGNHGTIQGMVHLEGPLEIGAGTVIEHGAVIRGPAIIGENCTIRAGAYLRGHVIVGDRSIVGHATELKHAVLFEDVRVSHFNYVGDSLLGAAVHLGAGAKIANTRFDERSIRFEGADTNRRKFGVILGDRVQLGVNVMLGPGIAVPKGVWIPSEHQRKSGVYRADPPPLLRA